MISQERKSTDHYLSWTVMQTPSTKKISQSNLTMYYNSINHEQVEFNSGMQDDFTLKN